MNRLDFISHLSREQLEASKPTMFQKLGQWVCAGAKGFATAETPEGAYALWSAGVNARKGYIRPDPRPAPVKRLRPCRPVSVPKHRSKPRPPTIDIDFSDEFHIDIPVASDEGRQRFMSVEEMMRNFEYQRLERAAAEAIA